MAHALDGYPVNFQLLAKQHKLINNAREEGAAKSSN